MRLFRLLILMTTLLSLPGYGLAATGHAGGCPERAPAGAPAASHHTAMVTMGMAGMGDGAVSHDCCPGSTDTQPASQHQGCPSCIAGHACKSPQSAQAPGALIRQFLPFQAAAFDAPSRLASLCGPDALLRPPNLS
ncbi:MAG: hypothetical protein IT480_11690 [Gammaproteobacteria bacterium]|nr:hypothetical protein [Gammaproteobacteria bacterium]